MTSKGRDEHREDKRIHRVHNAGWAQREGEAGPTNHGLWREVWLTQGTAHLHVTRLAPFLEWVFLLVVVHVTPSA